ncbi:MAG: Na+/H+ antiporter NhaC family protein, partial [Candidatus Krumholzibacteria bacterium]|nr:Na+/H+ antiporter NhaC family protein [Candidatus Krumholzibacteria bacterium]
NQSFTSLGIERNPFTTFVASLPFSFYPILAILFVLFIILTGRDYSMMLEAERRARITGKVSSDTAMPLSNIDSESVSTAEVVKPRWINGVIPIAVVIAVAFIGLIHTGRASLKASGHVEISLLAAIKESNSFKALLWSSFAGCLTAGLLALCQRLLSLTETVASWINGMRSMLNAIIILVLAWCIGRVCTELHTADYLVHNLSEVLTPGFLPLIVFLLAMGISFSTGTSWGTMSILTPIVIPLVFGMVKATGLSGSELEPILLASIAAILSGAVFGDHCSPISDTTIMSSMSSAADHIDHVRTQLPYAITVGCTSLVFGYFFTALGIHSLISLVTGSVFLFGVLRIVGRSPERTG